VKRKNNPDESFIQRLRTAKKLNVNFEDHYYPVPAHILRHGRDIAFETVGIDIDVFPNTKGEYPQAAERAVEEAFEGFVEGYFESIVPAKNPGRKRSETAWRNFVDKFKKNIAAWFNVAESSDTAQVKTLVLKSGIMKIVDVFTQGALHIKKSTLDDGGPTLKEADLGQNFVHGLSKDAVSQIVVNRYYQALATTIVSSMVEKFYELEGSQAALRQIVDGKLRGRKLSELLDKTFQEAVMNEVSRKMRMELNQVDILRALK
jgi:hypothetical protein